MAYLYAPDRKAEHPIRHLAGFEGTLQVDGYAGYKVLAARKGCELGLLLGARAPPVLRTGQGLARRRSRPRCSPASPNSIGSRARSAGAPPTSGGRASGPQPAGRGGAGAVAHHQARADQPEEQARRGDPLRAQSLGRLSLFLDDGRVEIDNNTVERAIRPLALTRKKRAVCRLGRWGRALGCRRLAGRDLQAERVEPTGLPDDAINRIIAGHPQSNIDDLLPWATHHSPQSRGLRTTLTLG